jgi:hypothetical protein
MSGLWHRIFALLRAAERRRGGKDPNASAAIMHSQSTKTTEEGGGSNGYDVHENVKGRKRDTRWSTPWVCRSRSVSHPPTHRPGPERARGLLD